MTEAYAKWLIRNRWTVLFGSILLSLAMGLGLRYFSFDADYRVFFKADYPQVLALDSLHRTYSKSDSVLFVVSPRGGARDGVFDRDVLAAVKELTDRAWSLPFAVRVESLTNFQYSRAAGDDLIITDLVPDPAALDDAALRHIREVALSEPGLINRLVSTDGHAVGVNVIMALPDGDNAVVVDAAHAATTLRNEILDYHGDLVEIRQTGMVSMTAAFTDVIVDDMTNLMPLMFAAIIIAIVLMFRSFWATVGLLLVMQMSIIVALGVVSLFGVALTPPSASTPNMIMTLAIADGVHFLTLFYRARRRGRSREDALVESMRLNFWPMFLTTVATALGFMTMNFSDSPPFHDLGNMTAIGAVAAFLLSITLLPALMAIVPSRGGAEYAVVDRYTRFLAEFTIRRRRIIVAVFPAVAVVLGFFALGNQLDDRFVEYFSPDNAFRSDTEYTMENLTGIYSLEFSLRAGADDGIAEPHYLQWIGAFADWLRSQPEVLHVSVFSDVMKRINRNMNADDPAYYVVPTERSTALQYLLLYEMSLPYGFDLNTQIDVGKSATRLTASLKNLSTVEMRNLERAANAWLDANAPADSYSEATSPTVMFSHISETNIRAMLGATLLALALISLALIAAFRSVAIGLVSLIPNLLPAVIAFGLWGLFVGEVGLAVSIVSAMTLGIIVDDTIHFTSKYLHGVRYLDLSPEAAVRYAYANVAGALTFTTIILGGGFFVLSLSSFAMNADMGLLTAITLVVALILDLLFLPALLVCLFARRPTAEAVVIEWGDRKGTSVVVTKGEMS
ncbi:MAG: MMPL family transporter [Aquisalimonadaceae bacterium]